MDLTALFTSGMAELIAGQVSGALIEYVFPSDASVSSATALRVFVEVLAQAAAGLAVAYYALEMVSLRGLIYDPAPRVIFALAFIAGQPSFSHKIAALNVWAIKTVKGLSFISGVPESASSVKPTIMEPTAQMNYQASLNNQTGDFDANMED